MWHRTSLLNLLVLASVASSSASEDTHKLLSDVVEWACSESNGGWMSPKIEVRPIGNDGLSGIFTKQALAEGEVVLDIPWNLILKPPEGAAYCDQMAHIGHAITKDAAFQTPYERYLTTRAAHKPPHYWSQPGKELLTQLMQGFHTKGFQKDQRDIYSNSCEKEATASDLDAMMLLQTRGEGEKIDLLVPIGDLLNHRNGNHTNVDPELTPGEKYQIITTRAVQPGEQLQNSYNKCKWCRMYSNPKSQKDFYVTPQIFEIYGFVELLPQRWVIPTQRLLFDIVDDNPQNGIKANLMVKPSRQALAYLTGRLHMLQGFRERHQDRTDLPAHELQALLSFYDAMVAAFRLALQEAKSSNTSEYVWKMPVNKWYWEY